MIEILQHATDEERRQAPARIVCHSEPLSDLLNLLVRTEDGRIHRLGELPHPRKGGTWTDYLVNLRSEW